MLHGIELYCIYLLIRPYLFRPVYLCCNESQLYNQEKKLKLFYEKHIIEIIKPVIKKIMKLLLL